MPADGGLVERRPVAPRAEGVGARGGGVPPVSRVVTARPLLSCGRARFSTEDLRDDAPSG